MNNYRIPEKVTYANYPDLFTRVVRELRGKEEVLLDFEGMTLDSPTKAFIRSLAACKICRIRIPEPLREHIAYPRSTVPSSAAPTSLLERIGGMIYEWREKIFLFAVIFVDMLFYAIQSLVDRRHILRGSTTRNAYDIGYRALPIVILLAFLIGLTISLQAAIQMAKLGGQNYLSTLIGIAMFTELGPLITAIIIAGRTGSAIAAEIGTMVVMEEVDALKTMGVNPLKFTLVPKFWAFTLSMPILTLVACFAGIAGGLTIAVAYDVPAPAFINQIIAIMKLKDLGWGVIKSITFAWVILAIACYQGLHVRGGADAVGRATTDSVVVSIFTVIVVDAIYSLILYT